MRRSTVPGSKAPAGPRLAAAALVAVLAPVLAPAPAPAAAAPVAPRAGARAASRPDAVELSYYLPAGEAYDPAIPTPQSVLGYQVGERHVRPDRLVDYMERVAAASDRVRIEEIGRTFEGRPQVLLTISSPEHLAHLDELVARHRALSEPGALPGDGPAADLSGEPVFVYLGYSIHGNEASGANASMLVAYHLAAARGEEVTRWLDRAVILLDPALNPDGLGRFAQWADQYRGAQAVADPADREHVEAWPGGRTNHYWFDLNRDWLLLQQPESRHRVAVFQRFRPNVLADFHEMGSSSTFFFQPGVPSRQNPLTPPENLALTRELARYHARALDAAGSLYFSQERYDDFYFGKGSTYPDIQGAVGILFEQASARGHEQETGQGLLTFPFAIRNQFLTSLSTLRGATDKRQELLSYQRRFYADALAAARRSPVRAYVVGDRHDPARAAEMVAVLRGHGIEVRRLARELTVDGETYEPGSAYVVPTAQRQYRLLQALFERPTEFADTTFYDVSAWTLPLAFDLPYAGLDERAFRPELAGEAVGEAEIAPGRVAAGRNPVAWAFEWTGAFAPRALDRLERAGIAARVATEPFAADTPAGRHTFCAGTVVVPLGLQPERSDEVRRLLETAAGEDGVDVFSLASGLSAGGVDLGSPSLEPLALPKPMIVIGDGVSSYSAGEAWFLLDRRVGMDVSLVDRSYLGRVDLSRYTSIVLVDGNWEGLSEDEVQRLGEWVRRGGTLVATGRAAVWAEGALLGLTGDGAPGPPPLPLSPPEPRPYGRFTSDAAVPLVAGTIFEARLDLTHPLAYGYTREELPVFRDSTLTLTPSSNPYETPVRYAEAPLLAGYVSPENLARLAGTPAVIATRVGRGLVVRMVDDPAFRGVWYGTEKLLLNAVFFGPVVERTDLPAGVRPRQ